MRADADNEKHTNEDNSIDVDVDADSDTGIAIYMTANTPTRVEDIADDSTVYKVTPSRSRSTRRRKVHLTDDCSHCPDDTDGVRAGTLHQTDRICQYCRGWSPDGSADDVYEQLRKVDSLSDYRRQHESNSEPVPTGQPICTEDTDE